MTEHRHTLAIASAEPAPEGVNGRVITFTCETCDHTHKTVTLRDDKEIQTELDAYNTDAS